MHVSSRTVINTERSKPDPRSMCNCVCASLRRQARFARRMHVGKIKYRGQHRAEDRANTFDRGDGAEHMTDMLRQGALAAPERICSKNERLSA